MAKTQPISTQIQAVSPKPVSETNCPVTGEELAKLFQNKIDASNALIPWKRSIADAVKDAVSICHDDRKRLENSLWMDISDALREDVNAWTEIEDFSRIGDEDSDLQLCAGFAFFCGMVYASMGAYKFDLSAPKEQEKTEEVVNG